VLRLAVVVISVGLADSLNPTTLGPALLLATAQSRVRRLAEFTTGVFAVNLLVGLVLTVGPGRLLIGLIPHPRGDARHGIELAAGVLLLISAVVLWLSRRRLARRELPMQGGGSGFALIAGASIAAVEAPTALPYFAIITAVVASSASFPVEILLIALFNVAFVLPLLVILGVLLVAGERADPWLRTSGAWLQRWWPVVLANLLLAVGSGLTILGGARLV
jgi:cytochrome c biogenesis protein CcdA